MRTQTIELTTEDGPMALYEALPDNREDLRGAVIVIQEAFGVNDHIEDVTRRLAAQGYHAVAPHLFHRAGGGTAPYDDFSKVLPMFAGLDDRGLLADVDATLAHLRQAGGEDRRTGGGIVTARFPQFPALVDRAPRLETPWLGLFGDEDESIPVEDVERLRSALAPAPVDWDIVRYPDAGHGFHCEARPAHYHREAAADGWSRTLAWFAKHLQG